MLYVKATCSLSVNVATRRLLVVGWSSSTQRRGNRDHFSLGVSVSSQD